MISYGVIHKEPTCVATPGLCDSVAVSSSPRCSEDQHGHEDWALNVRRRSVETQLLLLLLSSLLLLLPLRGPAIRQDFAFDHV